MTPPLRVLAYDTTERRWPYLSTWWGLGSLISGSDIVIAADRWSVVYDRLRALRLSGQRISQLSVWGHGTAGKPLIHGSPVNLQSLSAALPQPVEGSAIWWRSCEVHRTEVGRRFAAEVCLLTGYASVGHCVVVSAPNPLWQGAICGLRPGETPWWASDGAGLPGCSTLRMTVPAYAYTGER